MNNDKIFSCTLCQKTWTTLPEGTVQLTTKKRGGNGGRRTTYRFADGSIHVITKTATNAGEKQQ